MAALHLVPIVDGNLTGKTLLFVQGWPDDASLWDEAVAVLGVRYRCVRVTLPNFGTDRKRLRWGHTTEEIVSALVEVMRKFGSEHPVTLVLHDWGCYWGNAAHHRALEFVARVASFDIAPHYTPRGLGALGFVAYQWWLFAAFMAGGPLGNVMTRRFGKTARIPNADHLDAWMNYPYRNLWADIVTGRAGKLTEGYWPTCPLLFGYGTKKPFMFHDARWTDHVRKVGGEVISFPSDHWVTRDPSFVPVLDRWLA